MKLCYQSKLAMMAGPGCPLILAEGSRYLFAPERQADTRRRRT
jgi:hypothetical protein